MIGLPRARPGVLAFVDLVQDIDVMLPVLEALRSHGGFRLKVCVSRWLMKESPRVGALLNRHGFAFAHVPRRRIVAGLAPSLRGIQAVIAAAESSHPAHVAAHALALRAKAAGIRTYALQHGLENMGLFGVEAGLALFASDTVFCWFPQEATPPELSAATRAKLAHVGRPLAPLPRAGPARFDVGVFENLHWQRYNDADRDAFVAGLSAAARSLPHKRFLLRPHPAAGWADQLSHELVQFGNITAARASEARAGAEGGAEVVRGLGRVITTPSTVALDAAQAGVPVALAADGGPLYAPLPQLRTEQDWIAFAGAEEGGPRGLDQFLSRVLLAGDGAARIAERLSRDLMGLKRQPHA
jgi:hypothetical protein